MGPKKLHSRRIVTRRQLVAAGKSADAIRHALEDRRLFVVHVGVYAVGHPRLTDEERWLAAVLACGSGALLSARSAAELREYLKPRGGPPHVLIAATRRVERPGIAIRRTRHHETGTAHRGIPTTTLPRLFTDLAATEDHRTLRRALRQAEYRGHIDLQRLSCSVDDAVRGATRLRRTLARYTTAVTESDAEDELLAVCAHERLDRPESQYVLGPYRWDFAWPGRRVVLDIDEYDGHNQRIPFADDRDKDIDATARGWRPLRVADTRVKEIGPRLATLLR
jgi:very-short-patch-repair endonuclease